MQVLLIDLDPKSSTNIKKADQKLEQANVSYSNALYPGGPDEVYEVFNTQGYGYALIAPDGKTSGTHLTIEEAVKRLAAILKGSQEPTAPGGGS